jgi:chromosome segregation ATPase
MNMEDSLNNAIEDALEENEDLNWSIVLLRMEITERGNTIRELTSQNELLKNEILNLRSKAAAPRVAALLKGPDNHE